MAELSQYVRESKDEHKMEADPPTAGAVEGHPQLPEISISRTSTLESSKKSTKSTARAQESPLSPRVQTKPQFYTHWKPGHKQTDTWRWKNDPELKWHTKWDPRDRHCFPDGRVLIIDYVSQEQSTQSGGGKRHIAVAAAEFSGLHELEKFYSDPKRLRQAALRVIHVQNAKWATQFLLRKFNINNRNELVGMPGFSKWAKYERPRQRNGRPFPDGRSWRGQTDPWRNVARTAFGLDYLKQSKAESPQRRHRQTTIGIKPADCNMMHLNPYDTNEDSRSPFGYDVSVQRLSVYIQRNLGPPGRVSPEENVKNPYARRQMNGAPRRGPSANDDGAEKPPLSLEELDNSNTVIVFETSASMLLDDCLVQPQNEFEKRWRRLSFYLRKEDVLNDSRLAAQCTNFILSDVFHGLGVVWDQFLNVATDHVSLLEDKIYENPADESRAPELWTNQAAWLKVDKVMWIHQDLVKEMQAHMRELAEVGDDDDDAVDVDWIASTPAEYKRLAHMVSEDLVQPTNNLSDLMYKSVGIRDSRQSLQLGLSMWRLSWITFIFLPLTFIVGFFGMNVDTFGGNDSGLPSIGWYFVGAVVLMVLVLALWYGVKHSLQRSRQTPYQRGLYERLFHSLEEDYPDLWTGTGAVEDYQPESLIDRFKWRLLRRWFSPDRTIDKRLYSTLAPEDAAGELGVWAGFKRWMLRRWLGQLELSRQPDEIALEEGIGSSSEEIDVDTISQLAKISTPTFVADAEPTAVAPMSTYGLRPLSARRHAIVRMSEDRSSSRGSSGIMIEERNMSDSESDAGEGSSYAVGGAENRRAST
ncbi:hypothetical protein AC579_5356 [Pseudocercospora musae]|uniref:Uncharacterized protein n=1 Tax=Pseudocercospora musae TaxID=113226 RepID=A0A139IT69_9PEZI|nr:hypothetical protein AC579_5356 [Pseudocercospora musae]